MLPLTTSLLTLSLGVSAALCSPAPAPARGNFLSRASTPLQPASDPFYVAPSGSHDTEPGTVLRTRDVTAALYQYLPQNLAKAQQILYSSTDIYDKFSAVVTTCLVPHNAKKSPTHFLSYQTAEDAAASQCAPSYQLQRGNTGGGAVTQTELLLIDTALSKGWVVCSPDYEGPSSAFVVGDQAARGVLDGIRAALSSPSIIPDKKTVKTTLMGYSGGALASAWAAQQAAEYAPELEILAVSQGGLPVSPQNILLKNNAGDEAGLAMTGLAGTANAYTSLQAYFDKHLTAEGKAAFAYVRSHCLTDNIAEFAGKDVFNYTDLTQSQTLAASAVKKVFRETLLGGPGRATSKIPTFNFFAKNDDIVVAEDIETWTSAQCAKGANIQSVREMVGDHISLAVTGSGSAFVYLDQAYAGKKMASGCTSKDVVTSLLDPASLITFSSTVLVGLGAAIGLPLGPPLPTP